MISGILPHDRDVGTGVAGTLASHFLHIIVLFIFYAPFSRINSHENHFAFVHIPKALKVMHWPDRSYQAFPLWKSC